MYPPRYCNQDFEDQGLEMKKHALNIHALSTLYSVVITDVIDPGFSIALESSHHIEGSAELAVAHRHRGIDQYRDDAEKNCIELSLRVCRPAPPASPPLHHMQS